MLELESRALRSFNVGPGNWFQNCDLFNLFTTFGFPISFPSIRSTSLAASAVRLFDEWLEAQSKPFPLDWYMSSHVCVLDRAVKEGKDIGVTNEIVKAALIAKAMAKAVDEQEYVKQHFQRQAYEQILLRGTARQAAHDRFRCKMKRWQTLLVPRIQAERAWGMMLRLGQLVRPRVFAAVWRTLWNGWCTRRRFQHEGSCMFGCSNTARDCVEHYAYCPIYQRFRGTTLFLPKIQSLDSLFLLRHNEWNDDRLILEAISVFAVYTVFNIARFASDRAGWQATVFVEAMERSAYHAVQNHKRSAAAFYQSAYDSLNGPCFFLLCFSRCGFIFSICSLYLSLLWRLW